MSGNGFLRWVVRVEDTDPSTFTFVNDDGSRLDLTGMTMRLAIEWPGGAMLLVSGVDPQIVIEDQTDPDATGQVTVTLTPGQRAALPADGGIRFNFQRVDAALKLSNPYGELIAMKWVQNA